MRPRIWWVAGLMVAAGSLAAFHVAQPHYAYMPPHTNVLNSALRPLPGALDLWGQRISHEDAQQLLLTESGQERLDPRHGAVPIDESWLQWPQPLWLGRETFYQETFGNEVFWTDILGLIDGPLRLPRILKATAALKGRGTTNLEVELAEPALVGGRRLERGTIVRTGLDVPRGALAPLGLPIRYSGGRLKVGISCAACHAAVEPRSGQVIEGAPNTDLNLGLLLALGTNSAAYVAHTGFREWQAVPRDAQRLIVLSDGNLSALPEADPLEAAIDARLARWPPGSFDGTADGVDDPVQISDLFTYEEHPYGLTGFAAVGPLRGLSAFHHGHANTMDPLVFASMSRAVLDTDPEWYLGVALQRAAHRAFRFDPTQGDTRRARLEALERTEWDLSRVGLQRRLRVGPWLRRAQAFAYRFEPEHGRKPSRFLERVDPTPGTPGVTELVLSPTYPQASVIAPDGIFAGAPGHRAWAQANALAVWENRLMPANPELPVDQNRLARGRAVFERARCVSCHDGAALTNHRVIAVSELGTHPAHAASHRRVADRLGPAMTYAFDTPVPVPPNAALLEVPVDPAHATLAQDGYKVPGLLGLFWSAPYLHDGGVAVGPDPAQRGLAGTLLKGLRPDPANSLRALVDRGQRAEVIEANRAEPSLRALEIDGRGHDYWVDEAAGFSADEQDALVQYLLSLTEGGQP